MNIAWVIIAGALGGGVFIWFKIPGGGIIGAVIAVIALSCFAHFHNTQMPSIPTIATQIVNIAMGIIIGCTFRPELLSILSQHWHEVVLTTLILVISGCIAAFILYKTGLLSPGAAYLASSPGGLSAVMGIATDMNPSETPTILLCQMLRLYTILLSAPIISKLLTLWFKV